MTHVEKKNWIWEATKNVGQISSFSTIYAVIGTLCAAGEKIFEF